MQALYFSSLEKQEFQVTDLSISAPTRQSGEWKTRENARASTNAFLRLSCDAAFTTTDGDFAAKSGDVLLLPANAPFSVTFYTADNAAAVGPLLQFRLATTDNETLYLSDTACLLAADVNVDELFARAQAVYTQSAHPAVHLKAVWYTLFTALAPATQPSVSPLQATVAYIETHLHEKLLVADLAKNVGQSETTFRTAFKTLTGESPNQFIVRLRIEKAALLLADDGLGLGEIAQMLCFYDTAFFCKVFKNHMGLTPSQYRAALISEGARLPQPRRAQPSPEKAPAEKAPAEKAPAASYTRILDEMPTALL